MSKLRVLVLVREGHVPPETLDGVSDEELDPWKAEFDVCETLAPTGARGAADRCLRRFGTDSQSAARLRAQHHVHDAGRISRRGDL